VGSRVFRLLSQGLLEERQDVRSQHGVVAIDTAGGLAALGVDVKRDDESLVAQQGLRRETVLAAYHVARDGANVGELQDALGHCGPGSLRQLDRGLCFVHSREAVYSHVHEAARD